VTHFAQCRYVHLVHNLSHWQTTRSDGYTLFSHVGWTPLACQTVKLVEGESRTTRHCVNLPPRAAKPRLPPRAMNVKDNFVDAPNAANGGEKKHRALVAMRGFATGEIIDQVTILVGCPSMCFAHCCAR
jgi:hypothetical protein